ncbi:MAG: aminotransferase class V-fold PLP-dependent enzyme [Candidatus Dormibacteraeota bacterium]|nr:aminotransferase class V-fold PLP-dependent enzyme [Candidatus Dormibacteraeota bacterium]
MLLDERDKFEVDDRVAYFNTAQISPLLRSVRAAAEAALDRRAAAHTLTSRDWFADVDQLRAAYATLLGTRAECIALTPASSYGLATVAANITVPHGSRVVVLKDEFPSNYYTWERFARQHDAELVVVSREPGQTWTDAVLAQIDERASVVAVPNVHWTNGSLVDLVRVADAAHGVHARLVIDASQSLGVMSLDLDRLRPDALVAVGYKWLLGPYSLGPLYIDSSLHGGEPLEQNWISRAGSDDFSGLAAYRTEYRPGAERYDVGERTNYQLTPMALAAIRQLNAWRPERIAPSLRRRTDAIAAGLERLGLSVEPADARGPHIIGVSFPGDALPRVAESLQRAGVSLSVRSTSLRIAPHLHTTDADVQRLLEAVAAAL